MDASKPRWIWQRADWPAFDFRMPAAAGDLADAYRMHGVIEGKAAAIGLTSTSDIALDATADEVLATAAIEGERLSMDTVRSSVMRRLGLSTKGPIDRNVDGLVAVIDDATTAHEQPLDEDRLCRWHSALFPGGTSGLRRIAVGRWRDHQDAMQIVGGPPGREVVHYVAPPSKAVRGHMAKFLRWFARTAPTASRPARVRGDIRGDIDGLARAAIAHLWFESIHPFEDGNGRIGRAIVDLAVAQHMRSPVRLYSLSRQLLESRKEYYDNLNRGQRSDMDATDWVRWFARQCTAAYSAASTVIDGALEKRRFWERCNGTDLNERQRRVVRRLLDEGDGGFKGGLNAEKYIKMTGASKATATRDLADLVRQELLWTAGVGRALRYYIDVPGWAHGVSRRLEPKARGVAGGAAHELRGPNDPNHGIDLDARIWPTSSG